MGQYLDNARTDGFLRRNFRELKKPKLHVDLRVQLYRQDPLAAILLLVIFGRRALIFFCLKALGKYEK